MKWGYLSTHFAGAGSKRLTAHEVDPKVSNGHEFQGVSKLRDILGSERREFTTTYLLLTDSDDILAKVESSAKWYDSRESDPNRSAEWRLYYPQAAGQIQALMHAGDLMVIARAKTDSLVVFLAPNGSTREAQLQTLFGLGEPGKETRATQVADDAELSFLAAKLLEELGLAKAAPEATGDGEIVIRLAAELSKAFPDRLPRGEEIAARVQAAFADVDPVADPDGTLVRWIEAEDALFRKWEDGLIARRIESGFMSALSEPDVQGFRDFSMSIRQSRVSRAGRALQFHASRILVANKLSFEAQAVTEHGEIPDFLFPGGAAYHDGSFPVGDLRMLAAKFTAKDRWRQVLHEANRIRAKHLLTLEAPISLPQLTQMRQAKLQPVIPLPYFSEFVENAREHIISLKAFIDEVTLIQQRR